MKIAELRAKSEEELKGVLLSLKKEQFNLRFQAATGELANRGRFKDVRRTIARIMTVMGNGDTAPKAAASPSKKKKG